MPLAIKTMVVEVSVFVLSGEHPSFNSLPTWVQGHRIIPLTDEITTAITIPAIADGPAENNNSATRRKTGTSY
jgi:hypothetical protein